MERKVETTDICRGYRSIMEKKSETTDMYRGYIGILENGND